MQGPDVVRVLSGLVLNLVLPTGAYSRRLLKETGSMTPTKAVGQRERERQRGRHTERERDLPGLTRHKVGDGLLNSPSCSSNFRFLSHITAYQLQSSSLPSCFPRM